MSRPILSRPRTRVYGCNYDKGESYYKPMVDSLDRKYSSRPLFAEPRNSLADEIAARRSDIGSRGDLAGPRTSGRDLDLEFDSPRPRLALDPLLHAAGADDEDTVYDIRGQRSTRRSMADDFASEVASTTRRFRAHSSIGLDDADYGEFRRADAKIADTARAARNAAKSAFEDAEVSFKRRSKLLSDETADRVGEEKSALTRWSKLAAADADVERIESAAAGRAKLTKARLNDLETEMEEMAERQAKRERRAAALRALVNENASAALDDGYSATQQQQQQTSSSSLSSSSKRVSVRAEKHVNF